MESKHQPDPRKTLWTAIAVLAMLTVALIGLCYSIRMLWTLPAKP
jgi:hypothetical protein